MNYKGTAHKVGEHIDTDAIIPARFLVTSDAKELGANCMAGLEPDWVKRVKPGDIMVAGRNFGCGSSREHAPIAIGAAGCKAVVAESYARIYFRNAVATGEVFPLETPVSLQEAFTTGDEATLDLATGTLTRLSDGKVFTLSAADAVAPVIAAGGLFNYARQNGMAKADTPHT